MKSIVFSTKSDIVRLLWAKFGLCGRRYDCIEPNPNTFKGAGAPTAGSDGALPPYYTKTDPEDTTLIFESRFESGNLRRAIQVSCSNLIYQSLACISL